MTEFGKYQLVEKLGQGGMGEVWSAIERSASGEQRTVVIKRILQHLLSDTDIVAMFEREARLCARLDHPNVVRMLEFGEVANEYFLSMEFVAGVDLWRILRELRRRGPPPPGFAAYVVRDVCRALDYAHRLLDSDGNPLRLVHRDVTPSNVMVGFDGDVKLLDFGIAKALSQATDSQTRTGNLKGKFGYMAPEQVEGGSKADHRADQFSAGVVLHESLAGKPLFRGETDIDTLALVRNAVVQPPSRWNDQVSTELDRICLRALARNPKHRYPDCGALAEELDQIVQATGWDAGQSARLLEDLFPGRDTRVTHIAVQFAAGAGGGTMPLAAAPVAQTTWPVPRRRVGPLLGVLALLALVGVSVAAIRLRTTPRVASKTLPVPSVAPSVAPELVKVKIASSPTGAGVFLDDERAPRGVSPMVLEIPRRQAESTLTLRLDGYEAQVLSFTPDRDALLQATLARSAAIAIAPASAPAPAPAPSQNTKRTTKTTKTQKTTKPVPATTPAARPEDLRRLDVIDPFAR